MSVLKDLVLCTELMPPAIHFMLSVELKVLEAGLPAVHSSLLSGIHIALRHLIACLQQVTDQTSR